MSLTPQALRLLTREIVQLRNDPPEGVRLVVDEDDLTQMEGWVQGPSGTPYENGYFRIRFRFGPEYPNLPPKCTMMTKIFHPNVSKAGEICVDTLKKGWNKTYGVGHVLVTIKCLLIYPNPESALDEEAGKQLLADYEGYCKYAKLMTSIHATPKTPPVEFKSQTPSTTSTKSSLPNHLAIPSSSTSTTSSTTHSRPPNSTASTTSTTTTSTTLSPSRPAPLQAARQEQSPAIEQSATMEMDKALKPATTTSAVPPAKGGVKTGAASKAKRGLKRL